MNQSPDMSHIDERIQRRIAQLPALPPPHELAELIRQEAGVISDVEVLDLLRRLRHESVGIGILEQLLNKEGITDVVVNGPNEVYFDRGQGLEKSSVQFVNDNEVRQLATRLAHACGRRLDDAQPFADGRLNRDDGTSIRFHAVLSPPSDNGTCLSLRVLRQASVSFDQLVQWGTITPKASEVLRSMVKKHKSFLVVGGTGTGKTTMLSALLSLVEVNQRIICIEDTAELRPQHPHVLNLIARTMNVEGSGTITMSDLLKQALRMRPDRIVVGEIRGAEVVDLLAALNTGHQGGAGTVHANSLSEVIARVEALGALGGLERNALHSQFAAAVDVVLCMQRGDQGRQLAEIGVVLPNPLRIEAIWTQQDGTELTSSRENEELEWLPH